MAGRGGGDGIPSRGRRPEGAAAAADLGVDVTGPAVVAGGSAGPPAPGGPVESAPPVDPKPPTEREFAALLGEFRRTAVLVPLIAEGPVGPLEEAQAGLYTAEQGGVRWILAFSDEAALARFALARGEGGRSWPYRRILGARLLDVAVPAIAAAGVPCGVAVDSADGTEGFLLPPVGGVVPDEVAVDLNPAAWAGPDTEGPART